MTDVDVQPTTLTNLAYGVFPSFALLAGMQLELFSKLSPNGASLGELGGALNSSAERLVPVVDLLVSSGLLLRDGDRLSNSLEAERYLVKGRPEYRGELAGFYKRLWKAALKSGESIRSGTPAAKVDFAEFDQERLMEFFRRQYPSSLIAGQELAEYADFSRYDRIADIGGGTGGTSIGICAANPGVCSTVYDLPSVTPITETFVAEAGLEDRIQVRTLEAANASEAQCDLALLRSVLQVLDVESAARVLVTAYELLRPGGELLVVGSILTDSREGPAPALARGLVFLNVYDSGASYTESQHLEWLAAAGFVEPRVEYSCMRDGTSVIWAKRAN